MITRTKVRLWLCIALLVCNLCFIWGNSLMSGSVSGAFSDWVKSILSAILPGFGSGSSDGGGHLLRKLAHFSEFCCLGLCLSWLIRMVCKRAVQWYLFPLLGGFLAACADETIQRFVPDRGPSFLDVGIDTLGVTLGIVLISVGYVIKKKQMMLKENIK